MLRIFQFPILRGTRIRPPWVIKAVTDKMKRATALVDSLGQSELLAWSIEDKELVAPYAVELRHTPRRLVEHRVLPAKDSAEYVDDEPPPRAKPGSTDGGWETGISGASTDP